MRKPSPAARADIGEAPTILDRVAFANPLGSFPLPVPSEVEVRGGRLRWRRKDGAALWEWDEGKPSPGALFAFMRLGSGSDAAIVKFAEQYGVLGVTAEGLPGVATGELPVEGGDGWYEEPLDAWRAYATNADAVFSLAMALRGGQRINARRVLEDAGIAVEYGVPVFPPRSPGDDPAVEMPRDEHRFHCRMWALRATHLVTNMSEITNMNTKAEAETLRGYPESNPT